LAQPLFEIQPGVAADAWQPTADGQRFLVTAPAGSAAATPITVITNWQAGLRP
jgi:poly(3-hydroxybutyrate) depolymerase